MNNILGLLRTSALCLTLAVMAACDAEDFTRTAGDIPGKDDLANVGGVLRREKTPDQISALKLGEEQTTTDAVFYQLTQPAAVDVTVTVDADATLVDEYNKDKQGDAKLALFPLEKVTFETFDPDFNTITQTWIDIEVLRPAALKFDKTTRRAMLDIGPDLQYVLSNRDKYLTPLQKSSRKVLICITGGNTGLGFCNMTDEQIADFVFQLKYVVETYKLDGVNYFDIEASYGKDGMPGVNPASYAKLIKATKEALGDGKLVTVACDAESTDLLATAHDGIEAGKYIDYAWSGIFDEVVDAYTDGAKLKPIAGLEQSKYGGALLKTHNTQESAQLNPILTPAVKSLYRETQSGNVFAFWDMPTNSAGYEEGPKSAFNIVADAVTDWDWEYDGMILLINVNLDFNNYGNFRKDW